MTNNFKENFTSLVLMFFAFGFLLVAIGFGLLQYFPSSDYKWVFEVFVSTGEFVIMAIVFKVLVAANSFSKIIEQTMLNIFTNVTLIDTYNQNRKLNVIKSFLTSYLVEKCPDVGNIMNKKICDILENDKGYIINLDISFDDKILSNGYIETHQIKKQELYCPNDNFDLDKWFMIKQIVDYNKDQHFRYNSIKLNGKEIQPDIVCKSIDGFIRVDISFPKLQKGTHILEEDLVICDTEYSHVLRFQKPCFKFKVSYKHSSDIINPVIYDKYGRAKPTSIDEILVVEQDNPLMLSGENIFIVFEKRKNMAKETGTV
jgi:hypothetical protein